MKSSKNMMNAAVVVSLLTSFLVACAPANNKSAHKRGKPTAAKLTVENGRAILKEFMPEYNPEDKANQEFNEKFLGASLIAEIKKDEAGKLRADMALSVLLHNEAEAIQGKALINNDSYSELSLNENKCGKPVSEYVVEAKCIKDCRGILVRILPKTAESREAVSVAGMIPLVFRLHSEKEKVFTLDHSENFVDDTQVSVVATTEQALKARETAIAKEPSLAAALKSCDKPTEPKLTSAPSDANAKPGGEAVKPEGEAGDNKATKGEKAEVPAVAETLPTSETAKPAGANKPDDDPSDKVETGKLEPQGPDSESAVAAVVDEDKAKADAEKKADADKAKDEKDQKQEVPAPAPVEVKSESKVDAGPKADSTLTATIAPSAATDSKANPAPPTVVKSPAKKVTPKKAKTKAKTTANVMGRVCPPVCS